MPYTAIVTKIHTRPHPDAQKIQLGTCHGHQVVVGLDTKDGELGVFFPCDGQLSEEFVIANNLYSESARRKLGLAVADGEKYGFFSEKRRVRAQSFRGMKSDGFWVPLSDFSYIPDYEMGSMKEGNEFSAIGTHEVCQKYETPATRAAGKNRVGRKQRENKCFPKHDVSLKFKYVEDKIPADNAVYYITEKLHGTSGRYGRVLDQDDVESLPWYRRAWYSITNRKPQPEYRYLNGSKNVILEKSSGPGYYGTNDFRYTAIDGVTLHKGEILYFEIVGFVGQRAIMDPHPIKDEVKSLRKQYGETMTYKYGCPVGTCDIYVYKIVRMNEEGIGVDLPFEQVMGRCKELGLKHVPLLSGPFVILDKEQMDKVIDGPSTLDSSHIREGVVLRVESKGETLYVKNKSFVFGILEGYIKDVDAYIDLEEAS